MVVNAVSEMKDVESVRCDCCRMTEECTVGYVKRVRDRFSGHWICGLCAEAVKDEMARSSREIQVAEALDRQMKFHEEFRSSSPPANSKENLIAAVKQVVRRTLDSPRKGRGFFAGRSPK